MVETGVERARMLLADRVDVAASKEKILHGEGVLIWSLDAVSAIVAALSTPATKISEEHGTGLVDPDWAADWQGDCPSNRPKGGLIPSVAARLKYDAPQGSSLTPLIERLGRTRTSLSWRARHLGLSGTHVSKAGYRQGPDWSEEHMGRLREAYGKVPMEELAAELGRGVRAIYVKAHHMRLSANYNSRFTPAEDAQIRSAFGDQAAMRALCKRLNRNIDALQRRAKRLGLTGA